MIIRCFNCLPIVSIIVGNGTKIGSFKKCLFKKFYAVVLIIAIKKLRTEKRLNSSEFLKLLRENMTETEL